MIRIAILIKHDCASLHSLFYLLARSTLNTVGGVWSISFHVYLIFVIHVQYAF